MRGVVHSSALALWTPDCDNYYFQGPSKIKLGSDRHYITNHKPGYAIRNAQVDYCILLFVIVPGLGKGSFASSLSVCKCKIVIIYIKIVQWYWLRE